MRILSLLLLLLPFNLFSQNSISHDSLDRYSYPIYGLNHINKNDVIAFCGTGFFYKIRHRTYFITANHVVSGCKPDGSKKLLPDTMKVVLKDTQLIINIKTIKDTSTCGNIYDFSEIINIPVRIPKNNSVNFVEEEINSNLSNITAIAIYGYPKTIIFTHDFWQRKPQLLAYNNTESYITPTIDSVTKVINKLNYHIYLKNKINQKLDGFSGSPIFLYDDKYKRWHLGGVLVSNGNDTNGDYLIMSKLDAITALKH